jgi:hypothetical protein
MVSRPVGKHADIHSISAANDLIERAAAEACAPVTPEIVADVQLHNSVLPRVLQDRFDGVLVLAAEDFDVRSLRTCQVDIAFIGNSILRRQVRLVE